MGQSRADHVWNRAALQNGGANARDGDRALAALLVAHGTIMNGGVHHALETLSAEQLSAAKSGYAFFGFHEVPSLFESAIQLDEDVADAAYGRIIPDDSTIDHRFAELHARSPFLFAPSD